MSKTKWRGNFFVFWCNILWYDRTTGYKNVTVFTHSDDVETTWTAEILSWEKSKDGAIILLLILKCFAHFHSNLFSTKTTEVETLCFRACIPWTNKKVVDVVVWLWSYHIIIFKMIGKRELNHRLFEQLFITIKSSLSRFYSNPSSMSFRICIL